MTQQEHDLRIDYIEFPAIDVAKSKAFYKRVFGWKFEDYGPEYTSFADGRITGGFNKVDRVRPGGPLVVIYCNDLAAVQKKIAEAGGVITKPVFEFPGGRRFHFSDPSGNELAAWSER